MIKSTKIQIDNLIELLAEAHIELKKLLCDYVFMDAANLLVECQNVAITIGELIESSEGEDCKTIRLLEEYCEIVYNVYSVLNEELDKKANDASYSTIVDEGNISLWTNQLLEANEEIRKSVNNDIRVKTEVVFLPYNSAMWDSLESVYLEAMKDEDCNACVIPIPYFDRNSDGALGDMHYDIDKYPDDIPVMRYDEYDFENIHPDVTFIHNPYDGSNYVTSVHPFFYSKNLKKYTDRLVYIPYFVLGDVNPNNLAGLEGLKQFVEVPAIIYADTVIVQSENMRQAYINIMTANVGENSRSMWEKKILGLGSPKFDRVRRIRSSKLNVPDDWNAKLKKSDGTDKKIIFYNTSVVAMLKHKENMLEKMKKVFQTFKDRQDEIALIWRPHPLLETTIASMRPELLDEYKSIVETYKKEAWGVYDDSPNLDLAIGLCDAYYGDPSSVVQLCQAADIPVMIQNPYE